MRAALVHGAGFDDQQIAAVELIADIIGVQRALTPGDKNELMGTMDMRRELVISAPKVLAQKVEVVRNPLVF